MHHRLLLATLACVLVAPPVRAQDARLAHLVDVFVRQEVTYDPTIAYATGLPTTDHSRFADRTPAALAAFDADERADLRTLRAIDTSALSVTSRATYANLKEQLESDLQLRVCRTELWNVNHFEGWQSDFATVAEQQPIVSANDRRQALARWNTVPRYIDVEIANLKRGLAAGYSAPQSIVRRVIAQMDALTSAAPTTSPFYAPAARSTDAAFQAAFRTVITDRIDPALRRYRDFLQTEYLPRARASLAVSDLPNGSACYQAFLRANTTLHRTPKQIYDLGQQTVAANVADVQRMGKAELGTTDIAAIVAAIHARPTEHFRSDTDLLAFSRQFLARADSITAARVITTMPTQTVVIRPEPAFEDSAGMSSSYQLEPDDAKPATYLIELGNWATETRAEAEIAVVHETWPGHHLQKALARELQPPTPLAKLIDNAAYAEGWARYAEGMSDELGIYDTDDARILRRLWPARGMVVDPGIHAFHWTRQQAVDYLVASGRFSAKAANDQVDRIAAIPGQLTSYDTGGLEIRALRHEAETRLGTHFDLRAFNRAVLEQGVVPLSALRAHIESWIYARESAPRSPPA